MERINSRLDQSFNFETHYIRGRAKMKTRLALAVMMALALARAGRPERMRSLVGAVSRHRLTALSVSRRRCSIPPSAGRGKGMDTRNIMFV